jgi:hypothetical protein
VNTLNKQITYWGVLCRRCSDPVVFGSPSHPQFQMESEFARPGTIRCANGHDYIYFPRDFKFFVLDTEITDAAMERNRQAHRAVNPMAVVRSDQTYGTRWVPDQAKEAGSAIVSGAARPVPRAALAGDGADPRRESAQAASKGWWANWAAKKVS